jgi:hypothetical protein
MRFMVMIKATEVSEAGKPLNPQLMTEILKKAEQLMKQGILVGAGRLVPTSEGAKVQVSRGRITVTDGPFAETKELIGGYTILNTSSKEEAIGIAKEWMQIYINVLGPSYQGELEVRQIMDQTGPE